MKILYGFLRSTDGDREIGVNQAEAEIVQLIYKQYLTGDSLGKISDLLSDKQIYSPSGNTKWTRSTIDKLLSNVKRVPSIINLEQFCEVQIEKANRSNIDLDRAEISRKITRYSSQNVLSGLIICAECGDSYRRITRNSGNVVWRCDSRVEHGKEICKCSPTITEVEVKGIICRVLNLHQFNTQTVKDSMKSIHVYNDGSLSIHLK